MQKVLDLSYRALMLQDKTGPLANVDNRLAMACALNRQQSCDELGLRSGQGRRPRAARTVRANPVSAVCPTPDIAKAKSYLAKAGDPSGFSFTAITSTDLDPTSAAQATAVQSRPRAGRDQDEHPEPRGQRLHPGLAEGHFQAAFAWNGADPDPYTMYGRYFGQGANLGVPAGYSSPALQKLLADGDAAASPALQAKYWSALSSNLTSNAVWIWLFTATTTRRWVRRSTGSPWPPTELDLARGAAVDHDLARRGRSAT